MKNSALCFAPWVHSHIEQGGRRKLCCLATRPPTEQTHVDEHSFWNSQYVRDVRLQMLAGQSPDDCETCTAGRLAQAQTYQQHWNTHFAQIGAQRVSETSADGTVKQLPIAYDYRMSNTCNFKCRMCYDVYSSKIHAESKLLKLGQFHQWDLTASAEQIAQYEDEIVVALEQGRVRELYWAGGEPTLFPSFWNILDRAVRLDQAKHIDVRINTNLSRLSHSHWYLPNLLKHFATVSLCCSLDATATVGEYIRDGLVWKTWLVNFEKVQAKRAGYTVWIDVTFTTLTLLDLVQLEQLARRFDSKFLIKLVDPQLLEMLCPLALPRSLLEQVVERSTTGLTNTSLLGFVQRLTKLPTYEERFDSWLVGRAAFKADYQRRARFRRDGDGLRPSLETLLAERAPDVLSWWNSF